MRGADLLAWNLASTRSPLGVKRERDIRLLQEAIAHETNGIRFNQLDRQRLKRIRYQDTDQPTPEEVNTA